MPFTFAHPAAVIPLRRWLVLSALVVGSIAPDFEYFLYLTRRVGHSLTGVFVFSLPVGLAALWIFHRVMKVPLLSLAPEGHRRRLAAFAGPFEMGPARRFVWIVASLLVGIGTHLGWDVFTHPAGWAVRSAPLLSAVVFSVSGRPAAVYAVLQHGGTAAGLLILLVAYVRWYRRAPEREWSGAGRWSGWVVVVLVVIPAVVAVSYGYWSSASAVGISRRMFVGRTAVAFVSAAMAELLAFSVGFQCVRWFGRGVERAG